MSNINYAQAAGIDSFPLALVFCLIYIPLFIFFILKWVKNTRYALGAAALFSIVRVTSFGMRASFTKSESLAENRTMVIAESIIYSVGFLGVLSSAYNLVIDRDDAAGTQNRDPLRIITGNAHIMRLVMTGAVVVGIIGSVDSGDPTNPQDKINRGNLLKKISIIIFFVVCLLMIIHTLFSLMAERHSTPDEKTYAPSLGHTHGTKILVITGLFLTLRELFYVATMNNLARQQEEKLFYPFAAGTELIAVLTFAVPGLIPPKHQLPY